MGYETIRVESSDRITTITINRPDKMNALNAQVIEELTSAFLAARKDAGAIILTGEGEKAFAAGADIGELAQQNADGARDASLKGQLLTRVIESSPIPVIAAVNGFALGGGCEMAMACHIRLASENAKFGQPEVNLGLIPGYGGCVRLPRLVGQGKALELILTGDMIDAEAAASLGLANQVVPAGELMATATKMAGKILKKGPVAVRYALNAVQHGLQTTEQEALNLESNLFGLCFATEDMKEGTGAFLEKRKPEFKGQ